MLFLATTELDEDCVYAKPDADRIVICDVLRELLYAKMLNLIAAGLGRCLTSSGESMQLLFRIDAWEKAYEAS